MVSKTFICTPSLIVFSLVNQVFELQARWWPSIHRETSSLKWHSIYCHKSDILFIVIKFNWPLPPKKLIKKKRIKLYARHSNHFWWVIIVDRFLTISTNVKQKKTWKREETFARNQINLCARRKQDGFIRQNCSRDCKSCKESCKNTKFKWCFRFLFKLHAFKENFKCTT